MRIVSLILLVAAVLAALACDDNTLTPPATSKPATMLLLTPTPAPIATPAPLATPVPTVTLAPTEAPEPTPTPKPTATQTPTPTAAHTPLPTATPDQEDALTPSPTPIPTGRSAAGYTDEELSEISSAMINEFMDAIKSQPEPDLERAMATYSPDCQPNPAEFARQVAQLLAFLGEGEFSVEVLGVMRLPEFEEAAIVASIARLDGENLGGLTRSLMVYENGRWLDSDCEEARTKYLGPEDESEEQISPPKESS